MLIFPTGSEDLMLSKYLYKIYNLKVEVETNLLYVYDICALYKDVEMFKNERDVIFWVFCSWELPISKFFNI